MKKSISHFLTLARTPTRCALAIAVVLLVAMPAHAATRTWDGGGTNDNWKTKDNWGGTALAANDDLVFGGTTQLTTDNNFNNGTNFASITFASGAGAFTLDGNRVDLDGAITNNDNDTQTIILNLRLAATQSFDAAAGNLDISGVISGAGGLTKIGSNTLTLSGTNTFSGQLTVSQGTLAIGTINDASANGTLGNSSLAVILGSSSNTGTLQFTGGNDSSTKGFTLATSGTGAFDVTTGATTLTLSGVVTGSGALTKLGAGTLTLSGTNTYNGTTTINNGTLSVSTLANGGSNSNIGSSSSAAANLILNGGTLAYTGAAVTSNRSFSLQSSSSIDASGSGALNFSDTGSIGFNSGTAAKTLTLSGNNTGNNTIAAIIGNNTGATSLTKNGTGTWLLSGTNTYTGTTTVNAGTLRAGAAAGGQAFGSLSAVTTADVAGATLDLNGFNQTIGSLAGGGITGGNVTLGGATLTFGGDDSSTDYGGVISGNGSITKVGNGTFSITNNNAFGVTTGTTITVSAGTLQLGNGGPAGRLNPPSNVINNATYGWNGSDVRAQGATSVISGTGLFLKRGNGTYTLSGNNSYSGGTTIEAGTLQINNVSAIGSTSGTLTVNGGTLDLNNFDTTVGNLTGTGGTITSNVTGNRTLTIGQGNGTGGNYQGVIANGTGTTALTKVGTGTITFSGANTYTGLTTVSAGTLQIGNGGLTGALSTSSAITNNGTLAFSRTNTITQGTDFASVIAGTGGVTNLSSGVLLLNGTNTYTGATLVSAGTIRAGAAAGGQAFGNLSAVTTADVAGALLELNNFSQTIGSLAGGGTTGGNVTLGNATLTTGGGNASTSYAGVISGTSGSLIKTGTGNFTLTNNSTYTGATTISAGILEIGSGGTSGSIASTSGVTNNAALIYNRSNAITAGYATSGNGTVTQAGTGTTTFTANNTYTGTTTVSGGTLLVNAAHTGGAAYTVAASTVLGGTGSTASSLSVSGTLAPGTTTTIETFGSGALTMTGDSTFDYDINSSVATSVGADLQLVSGNLTISTAVGDDVTLTITDLAGSPTAIPQGTTFTLMNYSGTWNGGLLNVGLSEIPDGGTFIVDLNTWQLDYNATSGGVNFPTQYVNLNYVNITAVPEPSILFLLAAGGIGGLMYRRRRLAQARG